MLTDILTGDVIKVDSLDRLRDLEYWELGDGTSGVTVPESRRKHLRSSMTEEAIGPKDELMYVQWMDPDRIEREAYLLPEEVPALANSLESEWEEFYAGEIINQSIYAEPGPWSEAVKQFMGALKR